VAQHWKLTYQNHIWKIHNEQGKDLTYDPNSGIQILVEDGYAFKDLNRNGSLDPFEDWRLPMQQRVRDFSDRYHLYQVKHAIYYKNGKVELPQSLLSSMELATIWEESSKADKAFMKDHYLLVLLLMIFDHDETQNISDYVIQLFLDSLDMGVLEQVFYTIKTAVLNYLKSFETWKQLSLDIPNP